MSTLFRYCFDPFNLLDSIHGPENGRGNGIPTHGSALRAGVEVSVGPLQVTGRGDQLHHKNHYVVGGADPAQDSRTSGTDDAPRDCPYEGWASCWAWAALAP